MNANHTRIAAPGAWRRTFLRMVQLREGQLRFFGLVSVALGLLLVAWLVAAAACMLAAGGLAGAQQVAPPRRKVARPPRGAALVSCF